VLFDAEEPPPGYPRSIDDFQIVGRIANDQTNNLRMVKIEGSNPPIFMTLRSVSKQAIFDSRMQKHVCGERDIYLSLNEPNVLVPPVYAIKSSDSDIHFLYNTQVVGNLESFLEGQTHGEFFVRHYSAQVLLALEYLHSVGFNILLLNTYLIDYLD
jgi:serine/threonine protein kinase